MKKLSKLKRSTRTDFATYLGVIIAFIVISLLQSGGCCRVAIRHLCRHSLERRGHIAVGRLQFLVTCRAAQLCRAVGECRNSALYLGGCGSQLVHLAAVCRAGRASKGGLQFPQPGQHLLGAAVQGGRLAVQLLQAIAQLLDAGLHRPCPARQLRRAAVQLDGAVMQFRRPIVQILCAVLQIQRSIQQIERAAF